MGIQYKLKMKKLTYKQFFSHRNHYRNKLKYELIYGGNKFDLVSWRKHFRTTNTLYHRIETNRDSLFVNPLGVKTSLLPF